MSMQRSFALILLCVGLASWTRESTSSKNDLLAELSEGLIYEHMGEVVSQEGVFDYEPQDQ